MSYQLPLDQELIFDNFAGGGGASNGIEQALGRPVNVAVNHDRKAIGMHMINHPLTEHYCEDVFDIDPAAVIKGRPILMGWFSPDCKHHSKARGQKPVNKNIRGLAWVVMKYASLPKEVKPRVIFLENVEEFEQWGPLVQALNDDGTPKFNPDGSKVMVPCTQRKGVTFRNFIRTLEKHGYKVEWRQLRACDYGAPTIRKRLFVIARCDGSPIVWPKPTHAKKPKRGSGLKPYKTAADCIDWSLDCPSIFDRKKPLAENTLKRVAKGLDKFVINAAEPFIVTVNHGATAGEQFRGQPVGEPLHTATQKNGFGLVDAQLAPFVTEHANASNQRNFPADEPLRTQCAQVKGGHFAAVMPVLSSLYGAKSPSDHRCHDPREPLNTATASARHAVLAPSLIQMGYGEAPGQSPRALDLKKPLGTTTAQGNKFAVAAAHVQRMFGTSTGHAMEEPSGAACTKEKSALCSAYLTKFRGESPGASVEDPMPTVTAGSFQKRPGGNGHAMGVCTPYMTKMRGENIGHKTDEPLHTVSAGGTHHALSAPLLTKYYGNEKDGGDVSKPIGTVTTKDRFAFVDTMLDFPPLTEAQLNRAREVAALLRRFGWWDDREFVTVTIRGAVWIIVDIGMRMLVPRELARAQGFPDDYIIDRAMVAEKGADGVYVVSQIPLSKADQVKMIGNSVCPPLSKALVEANVPRYAALQQRKAA